VNVRKKKHVHSIPVNLVQALRSRLAIILEHKHRANKHSRANPSVGGNSNIVS